MRLQSMMYNIYIVYIYIIIIIMATILGGNYSHWAQLLLLLFDDDHSVGI